MLQDLQLIQWDIFHFVGFVLKGADFVEIEATFEEV